MLRNKPKAAKAAPAPAVPEGSVLLRCEAMGETRPFAAGHAARILALQERQRLSGDSTWQPVAADSSDSE